MDCAQIRSAFVAGRVPAGPEVEEHLRGCPSCRELFQQGAQLGRSLGQSPLPDGVEVGDLFSSVESDLKRERGVRAALRALSSRVRAGALVALSLGFLGLGLGLDRRPDFSEFSPVVFWGVITLLVVASASVSLRLSRGLTVPSRGAGAAIAYLSVPALTLLLVPLGAPAETAHDWGSPEDCFVFGALLAAPLALVYWLFERRDHVPLPTLACAGALIGFAANLLLCAHCESAHLGHLLIGHASIGVAWALVLGVVGQALGSAR